MEKSLLKYILIFFLLALITAPSLGQTVRVTSFSPPEAKLAAIDKGTNVVSASLIQLYARRIESLKRKCKEDATSIADTAVKGVEGLQKWRGVSMSILGFLSAMDESIPVDAESLGLSCVEISSLLIAMTEKN